MKKEDLNLILSSLRKELLGDKWKNKKTNRIYKAHTVTGRIDVDNTSEWVVSVGLIEVTNESDKSIEAENVKNYSTPKGQLEVEINQLYREFLKPPF